MRERGLEIISMMETNGLDAAPLRQALDEYAHFRLAVPFIGAMSSGKSALINALLGIPLLPVGITATTAVPTALFYGENGAWARRDGVWRTVGLWDLRGGLDLAGVTMLRAACGQPFLRELPGLCLLDLPGLGAGAAERERAMRDTLPEPCACLLILSADEPVVRESEAAYLRELRLRGAPVYPVLTKCEKLLPEERARAEKFLRESLSAPLGGEPEEIFCVSARGDVEPVRGLLRRLQAQSARLGREKLEAALGRAAARLQGLLRLRMSAVDLTVPEFERRIELMEARERLLSEPLAAEAQRLERDAGAWEQSLKARVARTVERAAPSVEAMLQSGQNPASYLDDALRAAVLDSLRGELKPLLRGSLKSVEALLRLRGDGGEAAEALLPPDEPGWGAVTGFPSSSGLFEETLLQLRGVSRSRRLESLRCMLPVRVYPKLVERAGRFASDAGRVALDAARQAVNEAVGRKSDERRAAMEALRRQGAPDEAKRAALRQEIEAQLAAANAALAACGVGEEDAHGADL